MRTKNLISSLLLIAAMVVMVACSKVTSKELKVSNVKNEGETPDVFQVVDGTYTLEGEDGLSINVKMAVKKSLGEVLEVNIGNNELSLQLLDGNGNEISGGLLKLDKAGLEKLPKFVQQKDGTEEQFTFIADVSEDSVKDILEKAEGFKLVNVMAVAMHVPFEKGPIITKGVVAKAAYTMTLKYEDGWVFGDYYYNKQGSNATIQLKGKYYDDKNLRMMEYINGYVCFWNLEYNPENNTFEGDMTRWDGKVFTTTMKVEGNTEYNRPMPTFTYEEPGSGYMAGTGSSVGSDMGSGSSNNNWDAWLDKYEQVVDRLISIAKKAKKGDPSALTEYAEYAQEVQELAQEGKDGMSAMTSAQLNRYNKIVSKMATAMQ